MTDRKATDVLLDLEAKVERMSKTLDNLEFLNKTMLNQLNKMSVAAPSAPVPVKGNPMSVEASHPLPKIAPKIPVTQAPPSVPVEEEFTFQPAKVSEKKLDMSGKKGTVEKVQVSQRVVWPDQKTVPLANVVVTGDDKFRKTNKNASNGVWTFGLAPGKYQVHVTKAPSGSRGKVDEFFEIEVDGTSHSLELPQLIVGAGK